MRSWTMFLVVTRSDDYFPTLAEALLAFREEIVLEPDRLQYLRLLRGGGALDRKMWTLRQYETATPKAVAQWLVGMPRRIAVKPAAFARDVSGGETQSIWEGERHDGLERSEIAAPPADLPATIVRLGSATIELRYSRAEYLESVEELFRLKPSPDDPAAGGLCGGERVDAVVQVFDHVPLLRLPRRPLVEHPLEDLVELQEGAVTATIHRRRKPMEISIAVDFAGTDRAHRLHCLMVVINKILAREGRYHLHAAAVRVDGRTSMFAGDKGSGKSTLSCALGRAGATVLSEDHVFLREDSGRFLVSGCDSFLRITPEVESYFFDQPLEGRMVDVRTRAKKEVDMRALFDCRAHQETELASIFFPEVGDCFEILPLAKDLAVAKLLKPVTERHRFADESDESAFLNVFCSLVSVCDTWSLRLGPDLAQFSDLYRFLLDHGRAGSVPDAAVRRGSRDARD